MESRQNDNDNNIAADQVEPLFVLKADHDLIHCPISLQIMRYPVLASDGHHYELAELLRHIKNRMISPLHNDIVLSDATYDTNLKSTLDEAYPEVNNNGRYPEYDRVVALQELGQLFAAHRLNQVRELEVVQEQRLRNVEEAQYRRGQLMLIQMRARQRGQVPHNDVQIAIQQLEQRADVFELQLIKLWQKVPLAKIGRFLLIYLVTAMLVDSVYGASHDGEHNRAHDHMQQDMDNSRAAPIGMLVAAADVAIQPFNQNPNRLFNRMRGAASQYFARWRPVARPAEDVWDQNHVGLHVP